MEGLRRLTEQRRLLSQGISSYDEKLLKEGTNVLVNGVPYLVDESKLELKKPKTLNKMEKRLRNQREKKKKATTKMETKSRKMKKTMEMGSI